MPLITFKSLSESFVKFAGNANLPKYFGQIHKSQITNIVSINGRRDVTIGTKLFKL